MAPTFWILCRCKTCSKLSHLDAEGIRVFGREWNRNSSTYKQHLRIPPAKVSTSRSNTCSRGRRDRKKNSGDEVSQIVSPPSSAIPTPSQQVHPPPDGATQTLSDPEITLWKGRTISCGKYAASFYHYFTQIAHPKCRSGVLLAACQYFFLNMSFEGITSTIGCLKGMLSDLKIPRQMSYVPGDMRKIIEDLNLGPEIRRTICCPRCFYLYPIDDPPHACTARATRKSRKCLEPLFKSDSRNSSSPKVHQYFSTQSFTDWLARFIARPGMEDLLEESLSETRESSSISDIWDSNMWKNLKTSDNKQFTSFSGNLVFSLNVDWFNPAGNKSAGKHISLGTIALMCLNLPPHLRGSHDNIFLAGLIPGPSEPTVTQINHVLEPLVTELKELWTGIKFDSTVNFPKGRIIKVMLGPIICDLPAIRKVLGMAGHSSHKNLCSFCRVTIKKIDRVDLDQSRPRKARVLREQANKWKKADTLDERKEIFQTYGVRYSILYELPYFDPLSSAIVEPMHNIFLGLLKHHGQDLFGLKSFEKKSSKKGCFQRKSPKNCESGSEHLQSSEISGSEDGMEDEEGITAEEAGQEDPQPVDKEHAQPANELLNAFQSLTFATDPEPVSPPVSESESSSSESDSSNVQSFADCEIPTELNPLGAKFFTQKHHLQTLREVNKKFTLPSWIGRVPSTVGSAKGGKLKADEWVILFEIIMIPTLIQLLSEKSGDIFEIGVFKNLLHLTSITNIVRSLEITNDDIDALRIHLKAYRQGLLDLFPSFPTKPNHHYALHLPDCLSQFGPAPQWTAWSFERLNGSLASIPTNNHIESRDLTLLTRWVTAQNFRNLLPSLCRNLPAQVSRSLLKFITPRKSVGQFSQAMNTTKTDFSRLKYNPKKLETLDLKTHEQLLRSFKQKFTGPAALCTSIYKSWKIDDRILLIPRLVHQQRTIAVGHMNYTTFEQHVGNSTVVYRTVDDVGRAQNVCGQINQIFTFNIPKRKGVPSQVQLWFEVERFKKLTPSDQRKHHFEDWPHLRTHVVYDMKAKKDYIQIDQIIGHAATWTLPEQSFGIKRKAILVVDLTKNGLVQFDETI
ncbi:hypothetical protein MJO28_017689 [Puccinia striiformis f. sp. tritici]|nr:hypothetical protein MJO28_017689 [Puccinia striiformis f. sp. tritici]